MSADDYIIIRQEGDLWVGYHQSASVDKERFDYPWFTESSLEDAIRTCQLERNWTEYGFRVEFEEPTRYCPGCGQEIKGGE